MPTVYSTAPREAAAELAESLVENRLAACVNVVDCHSTYRWDDEITRDEPEAVLIAKTTGETYPELKAYLDREHPYEVPCIERFDESDAFGPFTAWVERETG